VRDEAALGEVLFDIKLAARSVRKIVAVEVMPLSGMTQRRVARGWTDSRRR